MAEAAPVEPAPAKKRGSNLIIIIVAALVAAGLAGGAVYFMTGSKHDTAEASGDGRAAEGAKGKGKDKDKPKVPAIYVKLDPPFVANFEAKGLMRFLQVSVEIMTRDAATAELVKQHDPMIRNDLLMLFGSQTYESISTLEGKDQLRASALATVQKIIQAEGGSSKNVEQLYFTSFVMQ
jgi:flagellar protein FliL